MNVRALAGGDVDAHAGAAEEDRTLKFAFGDHGACAQADAVVHFGCARIVGLHANVRDGPAAFLQMLHDGVLERQSRKVGCNEDLLILNGFHDVVLLFI